MRRLETNDWWPELVAHKDELSLRELAERFGVTPGAVSAALKRQGINRMPAPPGPRVHRKGGEGTHQGELGAEAERPAPRPGSKDHQILEVWHLLGRIPDREVAARAGVSARTIASFRARHGIPAYTGGGRAGARDPTEQDKAWTVVARHEGEEVRCVVIAADFHEAVQRASEAMQGDLLAVSWAGPLL